MKPKKMVYVARSRTLAEHLTAVQNFDMIFMHRDEWSDDMKAVEPACKLLRYRNVRNVNNWSPEFQPFIDDGWLLTFEPTGEIIPTLQYGTNYLIDIGNPDYQNWLGGFFDDYDSNYPDYDGYWCDLMNAAALPAYWTYSTDPNFWDDVLNPRTGLPWTDAQWHQAAIDLIDAIQDPGRLMIGNGPPQGGGDRGYYAHEAEFETIFSKVDGMCTEQPCGNMNGAYRWSVDWHRQSLELVHHLVQNWGTKYLHLMNHDLLGTGASDPAQNDWAKFIYCSFIQGGISSTTYYQFLNYTYMNKTYWQDLMDIDPGDPVALFQSHPDASGRVWYSEYDDYYYYVNGDPDYEWEVALFR